MPPVAVATPTSSLTSALSGHILGSIRPLTSNTASGPRPRGRPAYNVNYKPRATFAFDTMEAALEAYRNGEFLVVMDDENRENEGDLIIAASEITTEKMAWMIKYTSGFICIALPPERLEELGIRMMAPENQDPMKTAYTITVDYKHGTTTGISAHDRALTARALSSSHCRAADFSRPGHLVPLRANPGGVVARRGHTEAAIDLCLLAETPEKAGVLCELVEDNEEGSMMRRDACREFADRWGLKMVSIDMISALRQRAGI